MLLQPYASIPQFKSVRIFRGKSSSLWKPSATYACWLSLKIWLNEAHTGSSHAEYVVLDGFLLLWVQNGNLCGICKYSSGCLCTKWFAQCVSSPLKLKNCCVVLTLPHTLDDYISERCVFMKEKKRNNLEDYWWRLLCSRVSVVSVTDTSQKPSVSKSHHSKNKSKIHLCQGWKLPPCQTQNTGGIFLSN